MASNLQSSSRFDIDIESSHQALSQNSMEEDESFLQSVFQALSQRDEENDSDGTWIETDSEEEPSQGSDEFCPEDLDINDFQRGDHSIDLLSDRGDHSTDLLSDRGDHSTDLLSDRGDHSTDLLGGRNSATPIPRQRHSSELAEEAKISPIFQSSDYRLKAPCRIAPLYTESLREVAKSTGTETTVPYVLSGLESAILTMGNRHLFRRASEEDFDEAVITLTIAVWLFVCHKLITNCMANTNASNLCGTLMMSAVERFERFERFESLYSFSRAAFCHFVQYWEVRLYQESDEWLSSEWFKGIPTGSELQVELPRKPNPRALTYERALEAGGVGKLSRCLMESEFPSPYNQLERLCKLPGAEAWLMCEIVILLATTKESVIRSTVRCTIGQDSHNQSHELYHDFIQKSALDDAPVIYVNLICDQTGLPPTALQWRKTISAAYKYIETGRESDILAENVDHLVSSSRSWRRDLAQKGLRRYMDWKTKDNNERCQHRRTITKDFLDRLLERLQEAESQGLEFCPFAKEIVEIGFTKNPKRRLREHAHHSNSNYIMNLMQALLKYLYPGVFKLHQQILYTCWRPAQCFLGEIIFTQLANGYTIEGGGFSHHPAGQSNSGAYRVYSMPIWRQLGHQADKQWNILSRLQRVEEEYERSCDESDKLARRQEEETAERIKRIEGETVRLNQGSTALEAMTSVVRCLNERLREPEGSY